MLFKSIYFLKDIRIVHFNSVKVSMYNTLWNFFAYIYFKDII